MVLTGIKFIGTMYLYVLRSLLNVLFLRKNILFWCWRYFTLTRDTKQMLKPTLCICMTLGSQSEVFFKNICKFCLIVIDNLLWIVTMKCRCTRIKRIPHWIQTFSYIYVEIENFNLYLKSTHATLYNKTTNCFDFGRHKVFIRMSTENSHKFQSNILIF